MDGTTLIIVNMLFPMAAAAGMFAALRMRGERSALARAPAAAPRPALEDPRS